MPLAARDSLVVWHLNPEAARSDNVAARLVWHPATIPYSRCDSAMAFYAAMAIDLAACKPANKRMEGESGMDSSFCLLFQGLGGAGSDSTATDDDLVDDGQHQKRDQRARQHTSDHRSRDTLHHRRIHTWVRRKRSALAMTDTELKLIAAAAKTGDISSPKNG